MVKHGNGKAHDQEEDQAQALPAHRGCEGVRGRDRARGVQRTKGQAAQIVQVGPKETCAETREAIRLASLAEAAGQVLYEEARKAAFAVGLTCRIGNEPLPPCFDALMGEFWFRMAEPVEIKHPDHIGPRIAGIMQFTLFARAGQDQQRGIVVANALKEMMERKVWRVS